MKHQRLVLALALIGVGIYLLAGCIPVPGNFKPRDGRERPEKQIGKAGSNKPVRLGEAGPDQVEGYIGRPLFVTADGSARVHRYSVNTLSVWYPFCFWMGDLSFSRQYDTRHLLLRYNASGKLLSYKVYKGIEDVRRDVRVPLKRVEPPRAAPTSGPPPGPATPTPTTSTPTTRPADPNAPPPGPTYKTPAPRSSVDGKQNRTGGGQAMAAALVIPICGAGPCVLLLN